MMDIRSYYELNRLTSRPTRINDAAVNPASIPCQITKSRRAYKGYKRAEEKAERLGIIIVHFGSIAHTARCLNSFVSASIWLKERILAIEISILIVDNSGNLNLDGCRPHYGVEVRYFRPRRNLGYACACYVATKLLKMPQYWYRSINLWQVG